MTHGEQCQEFSLIMEAELLPHGVSAAEVQRYARAVMRYAGRLQRLALKDCNEGLSHDDIRDAQTCEDQIRDLCRPYGIEPRFSGDPRGAVVKLRVPSGRSNAFAGEGICVPARERSAVVIHWTR